MKAENTEQNCCFDTNSVYLVFMRQGCIPVRENSQNIWFRKEGGSISNASHLKC